MTEEYPRWVSFTDRYGAQRQENVSREEFARLWDAIATPDDDLEHIVVSVEAADDWYLEFQSDFVVFENVETNEKVGQIDDPTRAEVLDMVDEFIAGD